MPVSFPEVEACVHLRNEPDWPVPWGKISDDEFREIEKKHKSILLVGDVNYIHPEFVAKHAYFNMSSPDRNALMSMCLCKNKVIYGNEWSSLSANMCQYGSKCHMMNVGNTDPTHERYLVKYRMLNITCPS